VKIVMSRPEPFDKFLTYALSFLQIGVNERRNCFVFTFEPASTTPFSTSPCISLIESIKIFGLVRMELVSFIDLPSLPSQKTPLLLTETPALPKQQKLPEQREVTVKEAPISMKTAKGRRFHMSKPSDRLGANQPTTANEATKRMASVQERCREEMAEEETPETITKSQLSSVLLQRKMEIQNRKKW
jgi:hypothetical protein